MANSNPSHVSSNVVKQKKISFMVLFVVKVGFSQIHTIFQHWSKCQLQQAAKKAHFFNIRSCKLNNSLHLKLKHNNSPTLRAWKAANSSRAQHTKKTTTKSRTPSIVTLTYFDPKKEITLQVDASLKRLGSYKTTTRQEHRNRGWTLQVITRRRRSHPWDEFPTARHPPSIQ